MKLVVGLGNPGQEYEKTRHNIGFIMIDAFVQGEKLGSWKSENKRKCLILKSMIGDQEVIFLKPQEFMNRSGGAVSAVAQFYKIEAKDILVIHDDIDLPVGKIQLKLGGSSAGHNGLKDIILKIATKDPAKDGAGFRRLRIGVDRPMNQNDASHGRSTEVADYVLSNFRKEEKSLIDDKMNDIEKYIFEFFGK